MMARIGSLCSGYEGIGLALKLALGLNLDTDLAWHAEYEAAPSAVLAHHWPHVPNLHDITTVDWSEVEPVDWITGGTPCQDLSAAGKRQGMRDGTRSGIWVSMLEAISVLRPRYVLWENVRGALSACGESDLEPCPGCVGGRGPHRPVLRAAGRVVGDLSGLGYDASWCVVPAAGVGAPHRRERVFVVAEDADRAARGERRIAASGQAQGGRARADAGGRGGTSAAPEGKRRGDRRAEPAGQLGRLDLAERGDGAATDTIGGGWDGRALEPFGGEVRRVAAAGDREDAPAHADSDAVRQQPITERWRGGASEPGFVGVEWGVYEPAIRRWERALDRPAPEPTQLGKRGGRQLSPVFVEFMMGLPAGHVTGVPGLSRNEQLKILGNGVVPQQCAEAVRWLLATPALAGAA